jgi:fluoride exporter
MQMSTRLYGAVALGGALGGGLRYLLMLGLSDLPAMWSTLAANVLGALLIGLYSGLPATRSWTSGAPHLFVTAGFCGGLTTFSIFSLEILALFQAQLWWTSVGWMIVSVTLWLVAVTVGYQTSKRLRSH